MATIKLTNDQEFTIGAALRVAIHEYAVDAANMRAAAKEAREGGRSSAGFDRLARAFDKQVADCRGLARRPVPRFSVS
jgi:hypothetical protein